MSLLEVVVSSVVLAGSSCAALGVWNQAATEEQVHPTAWSVELQ